MARFSLSINEGSLARRTALHVGLFVLATAAFLALASFTLTSIVKGFLSPDKGAAAAADSPGDESAAPAAPGNGKSSLRPSRKKRGVTLEQPKPAAEEDDQ